MKLNNKKFNHRGAENTEFMKRYYKVFCILFLNLCVL